MKRLLVFLLLFALAGSARGQTGPAPVPSPASPPDPRQLLDEIAGCVDSGKLDVEIDLVPGRVPATGAWNLEVEGSPSLSIKADAVRGRVRRLDLALANGKLLVAGKGLRPKVYVESLAFEEGRGITQARFQGKGIWQPLVGLFRGLAMSSLRKLQFRTDIPSILRGDILVSKTAPPPAGPEPPAPTPGSAPSFLDLVREVRVKDSELVAFPDKPLGFGDLARFRTAAVAKADSPLRLAIDKASFQPGRQGAASRLDVEGRIDGEIENGEVALVGSRSAFSRGELRAAKFHLHSSDAGGIETELEASSLAVDLTSGEFRLPGGPRVDVAAPSHFAVRELRVGSTGEYSGLVDAELYGKVGSISRAGTVVSASDIRLRTQGARVVEGRVTGEMDLDFEYRVSYPLVMHYPIPELKDRRVSILFQGPFRTHLRFENAGEKGDGTITGDYAFRVPWPPVEQAALEVLRAKWSQDVAAVVRKVDFDIEPRTFRPCGGTCFVMNLQVTAEKKSSKKSLFRQICNPEGKADLVVDAPTRSFQLRNVKIQPRCKGAVGWIVNFLSPFLTKSYTDVTLFQMPADLPFTIESVGSGPDYLSIAGRVAWKEGD